MCHLHQGFFFFLFAKTSNSWMPNLMISASQKVIYFLKLDDVALISEMFICIITLAFSWFVVAFFSYNMIKDISLVLCFCNMWLVCSPKSLFQSMRCLAQVSRRQNLFKLEGQLFRSQCRWFLAFFWSKVEAGAVKCNCL